MKHGRRAKISILRGNSISAGRNLENCAHIKRKKNFPGGSVIKKKNKKKTRLPMQETEQESQVQSLGQEESLEEGMATHSSILP